MHRNDNAVRIIGVAEDVMTALGSIQFPAAAF
jgi:hypothetical protein